MLSLKQSIFLLFIIQSKLLFSYSLPRSLCADSFCLDTSWPTFSEGQSQLQPIEAYGSGVAIDKRNSSNVIILHRSTSMDKQATIKNSSSSTTSLERGKFIGEDVIMILDAVTGKTIATWGAKKFVRPHGIEVTDKGELFITDVRLHQVFKFSPNKEDGLWHTQSVMTLGEEFVFGRDPYHFCSPADVAVMPGSEDIYIADGYCNSRVVKFSKDGFYLGEFGAGSPNPGLSPVIPFNVSHAVSIAMPHEISDESRALSSSHNRNELPVLVFVADRNNGRIQCFTENGTFLYEILYENFGATREMVLSLAWAPQSSSLHPYGMLYAINGHLPMGQAKVFEISVTDSNFHVVSSFAVSRQAKANGTFERIEIPHDIAMTPDGNMLYVIEAYKDLTVKKFTRNLISSSGCSSMDTNFLKLCVTLMMTVSATTFYLGRCLQH